jgi:crossover junction endodeoxyribonuclease RuvC
VRILGIDPGSRLCGYGVIDVERGQRPVYVECGVLQMREGDPLNTRLFALRKDIEDVLAEFKPGALSLEHCFVDRDPHAALVLGEVRGLVKCESLRFGVPIAEYQASRVKKVVAGNGHASKDDVGRRLLVLLGLASLPAVDASDALALAVTHSVMGMGRSQSAA